ncbi:MAG: sulfite exporter TauE/SafE family protein [Deltaproteobacteria bacterium]|nr:sulfite exporter TauE/SafE family protein [Deltaproteobacteria bacterium]
MIYFILFLLSTATSILSGTIGMAGGIVLLSLLTFVLPFELLIPIHGTAQLVSNFSRLLFLRKNINLIVLKWYMVGSVFGSLLSVLVIKSVENKEVFLLLIAGIIFYTLFKPKKLPKIQIPLWAFSFVGFGAGFLSLLVGATGPFIAPFFLRDEFSKEEIVATKAAVQCFTHFLKLPAFFYLGFAFSEHLGFIMVLSAGAIVGTKIGVSILKGLPEKQFRILFRLALFAAACRLVYKVFLG